MPLMFDSVLAHLFPLLGNLKCTEIKNENVEVDAVSVYLQPTNHVYEL